MVSESAVAMASITSPGFLEEGFEKDIEALLREQHSVASFDRERELNIYRSGSAPPSIEGSRNAVGSFFGRAEVRGLDRRNAGDLLSEEEMRSHLDYVSYYYANENLNPRLPPPLVSKQDWRAAQRFGFGGSAFGGIGDRCREQSVEGDRSSNSLFSMQPSLPTQGWKESVEHGGSRECCVWGRDAVIGLPEFGLGARRRSFVDVLQEDLIHSNTSFAGHLSRPASQNAFDNSASPVALSSVHLTQLNNNSQTIGAIHSGRTPPELVRVQSLGSEVSQSSAYLVDPSLPSSKTPNPQIIGRSSSLCHPAVGSRVFDADSKMSSNIFGGVSSQMTDYVDVSATLACLNLGSKTGDRDNLVQCQFPHESNPCDAASISGLLFNELSNNTGLRKDDISAMVSNDQTYLQKSLSSNDLSKKVTSMRSSRSALSSGHCQTGSLSANFAESNPNTYLHNHVIPSFLKNQLDKDAAAPGSSEYVNVSGSSEVSRFQASIAGPLYAQYLQRPSGPTSPFLENLNDPSLGGSFPGASQMDLTEYQKAYLEALLVQQKLQYGGSLSKDGGLSNNFNESSALGLCLPYTKRPISGTLLSTLGTGRSPLRQNDQLAPLPSLLQSAIGVSKGSWNIANGIIEEGFASTLLEEFKYNKTRSFELADIMGHVVEFSADQYGSRFIQKKLETASVEEKNEIFPEILPHALALMTDVFGNYVIQKFFGQGTDIQRNQLASQLMGHVLSLSLQMYGCRVIQKALEVVDVEQQTQMVSELDGSVMKCVRDQNGNHVIQKCIECLPQERIQFIISAFYGQVVSLSTHPYGCRVIQRVLEHCNDAKTQSIMMDEILLSVCTLALDQYGNYVVQHVLQHGKPEERSAIISKLSGQIVKMSQQKFASNVIEKCLMHGNPEERLLLIHEMLGSTEENEPLQVMMKDQFANYVVQKVLETCDDRNREIILSRIKVHLNALKRYTYGKHIVARVEKVIAAGERRMGMATSS